MSIFLTGRRSPTTTLAQMHAYDLNLCTDLHCSRPTLTLAAPCSSAATSPTNALMGVGCRQPVRLPRANPRSARGTTACHFPRFRSLKAFGRRPRCTPRRRDRRHPKPSTSSTDQRCLRDVRFPPDRDQITASDVRGQSTKSLRDSEASGLSEIYTHVRQRFE